MSFDATVVEPVVGYLGHVQQYYSSLTTAQRVILLLVNLPIISIALNVLSQLMPRNKSQPPIVWHWLPWFGSTAAYGQNPLGFFAACREKYGDVFTFILLGRRVTVCLGSNGNNFIMGGKHTVFSAEDAYSHLTTPVFGKDVVYDCPNEKLMEQKKFIKFGLSTENFRAYCPMMEEEITEFMKTDSSFKVYQMNDINEWGTFDALKAMSEITILTASRTLQGKEVRSHITKDFAQIYADLDGGFTPLHWMFKNLPLESYRKRDAAHKKISDFYVDIIRKRKADANSALEHDIIASLMHQSYRSGDALRDHEVAHIMIALLMAGQHTSSSTGSWALLHIADRPDVAEALYQEQVKNFRQSDGTWRTIEYDEIKNLPVLDTVIRETLRIHPPIHSIARAVREDIVVPPTLAAPSEDGRYVIPKGDLVFSSAALTQIDPTLWKNPKAWDPARWSDPEGVAQQAYKQYDDANGAKVDFGFGLVSKGTESPYQPFGAGRHRCIGENGSAFLFAFAYLQLSMVISTIVRQLELRTGPKGFPDPDYTTMITLPKSPRDIMYRRRQFD